MIAGRVCDRLYSPCPRSVGSQAWKFSQFSKRSSQCIIAEALIARVIAPAKELRPLSHNQWPMFLLAGHCFWNTTEGGCYHRREYVSPDPAKAIPTYTALINVSLTEDPEAPMHIYDDGARQREIYDLMWSTYYDLPLHDWRRGNQQ